MESRVARIDLLGLLPGREGALGIVGPKVELGQGHAVLGAQGIEGERLLQMHQGLVEPELKGQQVVVGVVRPGIARTELERAAELRLGGFEIPIAVHADQPE